MKKFLKPFEIPTFLF